jgi:purine nucleoside phosphorylase
MNKAYDVELRKLGKKIASDLGMNDFFREGVYTMVGGPSFETGK